MLKSQTVYFFNTCYEPPVICVSSVTLEDAIIEKFSRHLKTPPLIINQKLVCINTPKAPVV